MELFRAPTNLLACGPTYEPISLVVLLHGLSRPSSELLVRTWTRILAFPTMNSHVHSIPKLSMKWTPSLIPPNKGTSGELNRSRSACGPPDTNSSLMPPTKHILDRLWTWSIKSSITNKFSSHSRIRLALPKCRRAEPKQTAWRTILRR